MIKSFKTVLVFYPTILCLIISLIKKYLSLSISLSLYLSQIQIQIQNCFIGMTVNDTILPKLSIHVQKDENK